MGTHEIALGKATRRLLSQVAMRQRLASAARRFYLGALALSAVYALLLLTSRLLALIPNWFAPLTLLFVPAAALLAGLLLHHRPTDADAARRVDGAAATHDLFLTATLLAQRVPPSTVRLRVQQAESPGTHPQAPLEGGTHEDFSPIVARQAEERAAKLAPSRMAPFRWEQRAAHVAGALLALFVGVQFLPQLDPFGREKQRQDEARQRHALAESRKATELRLTHLQKTNPQAKTSEEAQKAIEELKQTFNAMKPQDKSGNLRRLAEVQKDLGQLWRRRSEERLKDAFDRGMDAQRLGAGQGQKAEEWKRRLQRGDASAIQEEIQEMLEKARRLGQHGASADRQKLATELRQQLKSLSEFTGDNASSKGLENAVSRALEQLAMAEGKGLSKEAMKALQDSLQLTGMEMDALAQAIRDLQGLEKGMSAAQLAKMLNALKGLDGAATQGLKDIEDYEEFYKKLMAQAGGCPVHGPG